MLILNKAGGGFMKVAILGYGVEGKSVFEYLKKTHPEYEVEVFDENKIEDDDANVKHVSSFLDIDYSSFDSIVRSPSVPPTLIKEKIIKDKNGKDDFVLTSATGIFFNKCPAKIIGVTGTKGKGTVSSFIAEIMKAAGKTTFLIGNIGTPALEFLHEIGSSDVVVYELSSFQLWDFEKSPFVAVLTILEPDHLEVHKDYQEYLEAKLNIVKHQNKDDYFVYDSGVLNEYKMFLDEAKKTDTKMIDANFSKISDDIQSLIKDSIKIPGKHNLQNASLAVTASMAYDDKISKEDIAKGISNFEGLPHRLRFVAEKSGVKYYDDSIATTPGSAIAAIKSFEEPKILILGGSDKGADYGIIAGPANEYNVKEIFVIGKNREKIINEIKDEYTGKLVQVSLKNIDDIVSEIAKSAEEGDVVIMSPAAASFDMFINYKDRGEKFIDAVNKLP